MDLNTNSELLPMTDAGSEFHILLTYLLFLRDTIVVLQMSSSDRALSNAFNEINHMSNRLNLPKMIVVSLLTCRSSCIYKCNEVSK